MPRPPGDRSYVCGPYKHHRRFRLVIYTPGGHGGRESYNRSFDSEAQANTWKRGFRQTVAAQGRTVGSAVIEYLEYLRKKKGNKDRSIATSRYRLVRLLDLDMALIDLTVRRAQDLYEEMIEDGYVRGGVTKVYSVDAHQDSLMESKAFGRFCTSRSWLTSNPFDKIEPEGKKRKRKRQLRIDEARTYIRHCLKVWSQSGDRRAIAALLPMQHNLRATEVAELVARDVDDNGRLLWVAIGEDEAGADISKTAASKRAARIAKHLQAPMRYLAAHPATPDGRLFAKESGEPADRHWVRYWVREFCAEAGVPVISAHGLRGTYASVRKAQGASDQDIAGEMGHDDEGETARGHYIDPTVAAEAQDEIVADALFEGIAIPEDPEVAE